jgi:UDP-2-acetamido-3-amino-2,3-dideoxy-glucuronate N-acetyltransferase
MIVKQIINNVTEYDLTKDIKLLNNIFVIDDKVFKIFQPKRVFIVKDSKTIRGKHAHKKIHQFLVSLNGIINIKVDFGSSKAEFNLRPLINGIHIPPNIWSTQEYNEENSLLLVISSDYYNESEYIRDYKKFIEFIK